MRIVFAIPGDFSTASGGYGYDRAVLAEAAALGADMVALALPETFPFPDEETIAHSVGLLRAALRPGDVLLVDGLAYGALPKAAIRAIPAPIVALCHHPLCLETGLSSSRAQKLFVSERDALGLARRVVATSANTAAILARDFSVPGEKIVVAPPGTAPGERAARRGDPPVLLAVGALIARKGYDILLEALAGMTGLPWRLRVAGSVRAAPDISRALKDRAAALGLEARAKFLGEISADALRGEYAGADVFVSASLYEGYGMAIAEALSFGLPLVVARGGAADTTAPDAAALKVAPGRVDELRAALRFMLEDAGLACRLADASWRAGQSLPRWDQTARRILDAARLAP